MQQILFFFFCFLMPKLLYASLPAHCEKWPGWLQPVCSRPHQTWIEGDNELYLTGYAWHNRYQYPKEKLSKYNERAWGGGFGKGFFDENSNWHGLYAFAFLESHSKLEPIAGYAFLKTLYINENSSIGLGFTVFLTARSDTFDYRPFPGILPWAGLNYHRISFLATYVPGSQGTGNVLFMLAKYTF
ncbi:MAG: lipid IV(A) palmitoyltransferase PagP [Gammaproteobacteria bacterium]|nr:lipid IV(A) palmitoyltransferase PagP [Gammaproteobacteria bacterium]